MYRKWMRACASLHGYTRTLILWGLLLWELCLLLSLVTGQLAPLGDYLTLRLLAVSFSQVSFPCLAAAWIPAMVCELSFRNDL